LAFGIWLSKTPTTKAQNFFSFQMAKQMSYLTLAGRIRQLAQAALAE
jgi:hypothetical protein